MGFVFAFIALMLLVIGLTRIWIWFNANYAGRAVGYQNSRLVAGGGELRSEGVGSNAKLAEAYMKESIHGEQGYYGTEGYLKDFNRFFLTKDWVFRGVSSGTIDDGLSGGITEAEINDCCEGCCSATSYDNDICSCKDPGDCGVGDDYDSNCVCHAHCACDASVAAQIWLLENQAGLLIEQGNSLEDNARSLRKAAGECDDPWELCFWGDWGKTPRELRSAAAELDDMALELFLEAGAWKTTFHEGDNPAHNDQGYYTFSDYLDHRATVDESIIGKGGITDRMRECCKIDDAPSQKECINAARTEAGDSCDSLVYNYELELVGEQRKYLEKLSDAREILEDLEPAVTECGVSAANGCRSACMGKCTTFCRDAEGVPYECVDDACYRNCLGPVDECTHGANCYETCYPIRKEQCCRDYCGPNCSDGNGWGRNCDSAAPIEASRQHENGFIGGLIGDTDPSDSAEEIIGAFIPAAKDHLETIISAKEAIATCCAQEAEDAEEAQEFEINEFSEQVECISEKLGNALLSPETLKKGEYDEFMGEE
ncbi:MAG: hypothetical protein GY858_06100 [Candidatus Omnitrophica bacterium]|nr:hypothetical protein [Candidatus Omnitrophota bacterium]